MKKFFKILVLGCVLSTSVHIASAQKLPLFYGINLAGGEFGKANGVFNKDYAYPTAKEFAYYKSKGFQLVRLPLKWERLQPVLGKPLDSLELSRVLSVIDEAKNNGIYIIPDIHNYGRRSVNGKSYIIGSPEVSVTDITFFWKEFAKALKKKKNIWGYGLMNEPHDMLTTPAWFDIAQEIIYGIREADKKTTIMVGGDHWSSAHRWRDASENLKLLKDPSGNLVFEAHVYFDKDNSGTYKKSYDEEESYPMIAADRVKPFVEWLKENNLKGFIGEYGVPDNDPRWLVGLDNLLKYMDENNVNGTYWAGGPRWGKYPLSCEPKDGQDKPQMEILVKYLKVRNK